MAEKKRKKRRAYLDAFQKDEKGKYEYKGELYRYRGGEKGLHRELMHLWILCLGMMAVLIAAGCTAAPGAVNCAYVLIPYTVNFMTGISVCWGLYRLTAGGHPLRAYIYQASVAQVPGRAAGTATGAGAAIAGEVVFVIRNGMEDKMTGFIFFLFLEGTAMLLALLIRKRMGQMSWDRN